MPISPTSLTGTVRQTARGVARMVGAATEDTVAAFDVMRMTGVEPPPKDPFAARDPDYIRTTQPAMRTLSDVYFRGEVSGLEHIPAEGPVLLVGNHSGGTVIADTFVFAQAFYDRFGADRSFHQLAHDLVFRVPGLRTMAQRWGTVPASPSNMQRALNQDSALLVYPGGDVETFRPTWQSGDIDFAGRMGFVRLALDSGGPVIPVGAA